MRSCHWYVYVLFLLYSALAMSEFPVICVIVLCCFVFVNDIATRSCTLGNLGLQIAFQNSQVLNHKHDLRKYTSVVLLNMNKARDNSFAVVAVRHVEDISITECARSSMRDFLYDRSTSKFLG